MFQTYSPSNANMPELAFLDEIRAGNHPITRYEIFITNDDASGLDEMRQWPEHISLANNH
ncbi:MAG: hypothetical protein HC924_04560 [Synechococcaceae cyanobacterium SM2_3_2]|nr:hypothetical protein [Synechococcaceae cyanobacterium SM2_3_2]